MLTTLLLTDGNNVNVSYKTDLPDLATEGQFTVMEVQGLNSTLVQEGFDFTRDVHCMGDFVTFAAANALALVRIDNFGEKALCDYIVHESSSVLVGKLFSYPQTPDGAGVTQPSLTNQQLINPDMSTIDQQGTYLPQGDMPNLPNRADTGVNTDVPASQLEGDYLAAGNFDPDESQ